MQSTLHMQGTANCDRAPCIRFSRRAGGLCVTGGTGAWAAGSGPIRRSLICPDHRRHSVVIQPIHTSIVTMIDIVLGHPHSSHHKIQQLSPAATLSFPTAPWKHLRRYLPFGPTFLAQEHKSKCFEIKHAGEISIALYRTWKHQESPAECWRMQPCVYIRRAYQASAC